jgi:hypothetical protein
MSDEISVNELYARLVRRFGEVNDGLVSMARKAGEARMTLLPWLVLELDKSIEADNRDEAETRGECFEQWEAAEWAGAPLGRCKFGGEAAFVRFHGEALLPGHIYSIRGAREFFISGFCEWHFDLICSRAETLTSTNPS